MQCVPSHSLQFPLTSGGIWHCEHWREARLKMWMCGIQSEWDALVAPPTFRLSNALQLLASNNALRGSKLCQCSKIWLVEQYTTVDKCSIAEWFNPKAFYRLLTKCYKQWTKTFGSKCPAIEYLSTFLAYFLYHLPFLKKRLFIAYSGYILNDHVQFSSSCVKRKAVNNLWPYKPVQSNVHYNILRDTGS